MCGVFIDERSDPPSRTAGTIFDYRYCMDTHTLFTGDSLHVADSESSRVRCVNVKDGSVATSLPLPLSLSLFRYLPPSPSPSLIYMCMYVSDDAIWPWDCPRATRKRNRPCLFRSPSMRSIQLVHSTFFLEGGAEGSFCRAEEVKKFCTYRRLHVFCACCLDIFITFTCDATCIYNCAQPPLL